MIFQFKSTKDQPTTRCIKQRCLIVDGDWVKLVKADSLICMFCDPSIREYIREQEKNEKLRE